MAKFYRSEVMTTNPLLTCKLNDGGHKLSLPRTFQVQPALWTMSGLSRVIKQ